MQARTIVPWLIFTIALSSGCGSQPPLTPLPPPPPDKVEAPPAANPNPTAWSPTPDAPFRINPPQPGPEKPWLAPIASESRLANGMRVLFVPRPTLPVVVVQIVSPRGADQETIPGMGSFLGAMLEQGTTTRSALELSDAFLDIGADHGAWVDWDSTNVWIKVLPQHIERGVEIISDVIKNPKFDPSEVDRVRSQRLAAIQQQADQPRIIVANTVARSLYPAHTYGESILGTDASLKRITSVGLKALHRSMVVPNETFVIVAGNVEAATVTAALEKAFVDWKQPSPPRRALRKPQPPSRKVVVVDIKDAAQSNIAVAAVGVERTIPAFDQLLMANTVFGGMFTSRLNINLREKNAFTYGAYSYFDMRHGPGPFQAAAAVDTPKTGPALEEMLTELDRFCTSQVTAQELDLALGRRVKSLPGEFESVGATAGAMANIGVFGLPLDEYRTRPERLNAVTPDQVQTAAAKHMNPNDVIIVITGDLAVIRPQLEKLAFGPIEVVDAKTGQVQQRIAVPKPHRTFECKSR